jgi:hypothetical protein
MQERWALYLFLFLCHWRDVRRWAAAGELVVTLPGDSAKWTVVALPDTQYYSAWHPDAFEEQTYWACACATKLHTVYVSHLGDLVEHADGHPSEWLVAESAMESLETCGVPLGWSALPGNHDVYLSNQDTGELSGDGGNSSTAVAHYDAYDAHFTAADMHADGSYPEGKGRNTYRRVTLRNEAGGGWQRRLLFLQLEYLPRAPYLTSLISWADSVLTEHADRLVVISTHYAGYDGFSHVEADVAGLLQRHCNVLLVLGGHFFREGGERAIPVSSTCGGQQWVLVSDYQARAGGGDGWLRYYTFSSAYASSPSFPPASGGTEDLLVCAYTYSPQLDEYETDANSWFSLRFLSSSSSAWGTLNGGCTIEPTCSSSYMNPGYVMACVWIASIDLLYFYYFLLAT